MLLFALFPIEHKYDKLFRHYSLTLIPQGLILPDYFDKKIYFYLSDCLAFGIFIVVFKYSRSIWTHNSSFYLVALWLCALISILASPLAHYPIAYFRLIPFASPIIFYATLSYFASKWPSRWTFWILQGFYIAATCQASIGIAQYFHQAPLGLRLLGEIPHSTGGIPSPDGYRWIFDCWAQVSQHAKDLFRAQGTLPHTNILGGLLTTSLLLTPILLHNCRQNRSKMGISIGFLLQATALILTFSRSALFGWLLGSTVFFLILLRHRQVLSGGTVLARQLLCLVLSTLLINGLLFYGPLRQRGGIIGTSVLATSSNEARMDYQAHSLEVIRQYPFFGTGLQMYSYRTDPHIMRPAPHNIYLYIAAELGLIALGLFLLFLLSLIRPFFQILPTLSSIALFSIVVAFLWIGACDFYLILSQQGRLLFFLFLALYRSSLHKGSSYELA
jgi:O-antigen ligase